MILITFFAFVFFFQKTLILCSSEIDPKENLLHGSMSSIAEPIQTIREGLPRPRRISCFI